MRYFNTPKYVVAPPPPDLVTTLLIAASSGQSMDWPSGSTQDGRVVRLTGQSTVGAAINFYVNLESTKAAAPSSGNSTLGTTGFVHPVMGSGFFQVPGASTGFSVAGLTSGYITVEYWKR
jgi:hypothetical protein